MYNSLLSGVLIGLGVAIIAILVERHIKNNDLAKSTWRYVRQDISENYSIINDWKRKIDAENKFIEENKGLLIQPLPPFRDDFWHNLVTIMPTSGMKNENLIHHIRLLNQAFKYLNVCSEERSKIRNSSNKEDVKIINNHIRKTLEDARLSVEGIDKQYSVIIRLDEGENKIIKRILEKDGEFRPIDKNNYME